jgi:hypothetical protein
MKISAWNKILHAQLFFLHATRAAYASGLLSLPLMEPDFHTAYGMYNPLKFTFPMIVYFICLLFVLL